MPTTYVIRAFGGTLVITSGGTILPTVLIAANFRDGDGNAAFRSGRTGAAFRNGAGLAVFRDGQAHATFRDGITGEEHR